MSVTKHSAALRSQPNISCGCHYAEQNKKKKWEKPCSALSISWSDRCALQLALARCGWSELFTLGLAQCAEQLSLPTLLSALSTHLRTSTKNGSSGGQRSLVSDHVAALQRLVGALQRLRLDDWEYALLRAMVLFCPGESLGCAVSC